MDKGPQFHLQYMSMVLLCLGAQYFLQRYILIKKPELQIESDISKHLEELEKKRVGSLSFFIVISLMIVSFIFIKDDTLRPLSMTMFILIPVFNKVLKKRKK
jgi:hypothetical protein